MSNAAEIDNSAGRGSLARVNPEDAVLTRVDSFAPGGRYPTEMAAPADLGETLREYLRILFRRRWLVASIASVILVLGFVSTLLKTPMYTSTVRLQIDRNVAKIVDSGNVTPTESTDSEFLRTQYELLQSRSLAERVASSANVIAEDDFFKPRDFSILGTVKGLFSRSEPSESSANVQAKVNTAVSILLDNRSVRPVPGARLVDISYSDPVPARAQRIAAAYADAFVASNLDKRFEANAYAKTFLEDQLKQLKFKTEESEKALVEFGEKEKILELHDKSSMVDNNLAAANAALGGLISERIKNEQLWKQVEEVKGFELPQLLSNGVVDGLRSKRNDLVTEYQEKLETFKPQYPAMLQIQNRISEIDRQLVTEVKTIRGALKAAYESSLHQEIELKTRIDELKTEALDLQKRSIQYNSIKREVETNRGLYNGLLQRFKEVDVAAGVGANNVFIVDKPQVPGAPSSPNLTRALMLSLLLGLGAGVGAAVLLEKLDDSIRSVEDLERVVGLSTLGVIPKSVNAEAELLDPRSGLSEAYRSLCTSLQFATDHGLPRSMSITSGGPGEGKSLTSVAIAIHFARMGLKVALVDADMRNPSVHKKLGLDNSVGLSNYLSGACSPPDAFQNSEVPNLAIMAAGPIPPNAADLLAGPKFLSLITNALEVFDLVMVDGPPVLGLADALLLSSCAEATIFVVGADKARKASVTGALKRLEFSKTPVIGTVLTKFDSKHAGYGYGYGYGYGSYTYAYGSQVPHAPQPAGLDHRPS
jgi:capsular exopolysaccharide synthesis family protein